MAKKKKTTAVVNYSNPLEATAELEARLAELNAIQDVQWKTGKLFPTPKGGTIDITTIPSQQTLITLGGQLMAAYESNTKSIENFYKLKEAPLFKLNGSDFEAWHHDLNLAMRILLSEKERKELEADIRETRKFISEKEREASHMDKIAKKYFIK